MRKLALRIGSAQIELDQIDFGRLIPKLGCLIKYSVHWLASERDDVDNNAAVLLLSPGSP